MVLESQDDILCAVEAYTHSNLRVIPLSAASNDVALPKDYSFEAFEKRLDYPEKARLIQFWNPRNAYLEPACCRYREILVAGGVPLNLMPLRRGEPCAERSCNVGLQHLAPYSHAKIIIKDPLDSERDVFNKTSISSNTWIFLSIFLIGGCGSGAYKWRACFPAFISSFYCKKQEK